jgi:3'-phosphoadenosine 5'-phosphosulfate sulfotransferase (PAPS reductase)/FAD synthetase
VGDVVMGKQPYLLPEADPRREPEDIIAEAIDRYKPRAIFAAYSGGNDSGASTAWSVNNVSGCRVFNANTGIGLAPTRNHMRATCALMDWDLTEIRAKEDCGQDYRKIVLKYGFPGASQHMRMYIQLKERCVERLVRDNKVKRSDKILILTGIRRDESVKRMGYGSRVINTKGAQVWVNPLYWWPKERFEEYRKACGVPDNPVTKVLGMSGECLCGAYAHKGEKSLIRIVDPETAAYLDELEKEVRAAGHDWGWEDSPPEPRDMQTISMMFDMPLCVGCGKAAA